jgi:hypothetical protein
MDPGLRRLGRTRWARIVALAPLLGVLLCLGAPALAGAADKPDPSKLWEAYPLEQKPTQTDRRVASVVHSVDYRYVSAARPGDLSYGGDPTDARLVMQLAMLIAVMYVGFLAVWFLATRNLRTVGIGDRLLGRLRDPRAEAPRPAGGDSGEWTCRTVWRPDRSCFEVVARPPGGGRARVLGDSRRVDWARDDEIERVLDDVVRAIESAGWTRSAQDGPWAERQFTWRAAGDPPDRLGDSPPRGARARFRSRRERHSDRPRHRA